MVECIGMAGGKFLERGRVKKPSLTSGRQEFYSHADFYVGVTLNFNNYHFVLVEADEYAYNYMEQHHQQVYYSRNKSFFDNQK